MDRLFVTKGEKVIYNNKECIIVKIIDVNTVSVEEINSHTIYTLSVDKLMPTNEIEGILEDNDYLALSEKDWEKAKERFRIINPILQDKGNFDLVKSIEKKEKVSVPTLYRWIRLYEETGVISSLAGKKRNGGRGKSRLTSIQEEIVNDKIYSVYLNNSRQSITKTIRSIQLECRKLNTVPPHDNTIRNRIKLISDEELIRKRYGIKEARNIFEPIKKSFPNADYPLSVVQIDHTRVDLILVDEQYREPYMRPWLTLAIDVYSRMIVGLFLSFESPGALGTGMCISNSILPKEMWLNSLGIDADWPCWGVMNTIHVDNAKEFRGNMLKKACENYNINLKFRPIATPHWGGHIERMLGTLAKEIHNLPGTTFSSKEERKNYKSEEKSSMTLKEFEKWIVIFITKIYHNRVHSSLGRSPMDVYKEGILGSSEKLGIGIPTRIFNERKVRLDFMPYEERTIQEYGVVIDYIHYYSDVLRPYIHNKGVNGHKKKFIFRRDPRDISLVYFFDPISENYLEIPYRNTSLPSLSIWEYRDLAKKLKRNERPINEDTIFDAYREIDDIQSRAVRTTKKHRKNPELSFVSKKKEENIIFQDIEKDIDIEEILPFEDIEDEAFDN
jgi:putative transposase